MAEISVDSIQTGTETITSGTTNNVTITSVDTSRSIVMYTARNADTVQRCNKVFMTALLTSSTNIQLNRSDAFSPPTIVLEWTVIEFASDCVESLTTGTETKTANPSNITLTALTLDKAFSILNTYTNVVTLNKFSGMTSRLTSTTNLEIRASSHTTGQTASYQVIEFTSDSGVTVQSGEITIAASGGSGTDTITSVDTGKTFLLNAGYRSTESSSGPLRNKCEVALTNATTVTAYRSTQSGYASYVAYYAVELSGSGQSVETATVTISDGNTTPTQPSWTALSTTDTAIMDGASSYGNTHGPDSGGSIYPTHNWASVKLDAGADGATITRTGTNGDVSVTIFAVDFSSVATTPKPLPLPHKLQPAFRSAKRVPSAPVKINSAHPLAREIAVCALPVGGVFQDIVSGRVAERGSATADRLSHPEGLAYRANTDGDYAVVINDVENIDGTADFTIAARARTLNNTPWQNLSNIILYGNPGGTPTAYASIQMENAIPSRLKYLTYGVYANETHAPGGTHSKSNGLYWDTLHAFSRRNGDFEMYHTGKNRATHSPASTRDITSNGETDGVLLRLAEGQKDYNPYVLYGFVWGRALSAAEHWQLYNDPFCFLKPASPVHYTFGAAAGGGPTTHEGACTFTFSASTTSARIATFEAAIVQNSGLTTTDVANAVYETQITQDVVTTVTSVVTAVLEASGSMAAVAAISAVTAAVYSGVINAALSASATSSNTAVFEPDAVFAQSGGVLASPSAIYNATTTITVNNAVAATRGLSLFETATAAVVANVTTGADVSLEGAITADAANTLAVTAAAELNPSVSIQTVAQAVTDATAEYNASVSAAQAAGASATAISELFATTSIGATLQVTVTGTTTNITVTPEDGRLIIISAANRTVKALGNQRIVTIETIGRTIK